MLLPFVLVNHNERHQLPLIAMQAVAIGACAQALADRLGQETRAMRRPAVSLTAAALLCLYWWMATSVSDSICTTGDEIAHLTAGYSYWKTDDYRLQPENGNLPQRWAAIPLLHRDLKFPTQDQDAWRISDVWDLGFQWFYTLGNDLASMLRAGRRMIALLGVATGRPRLPLGRGACTGTRRRSWPRASSRSARPCSRTAPSSRAT